MVTFRCVRCGEDVDVPDDDVQIKKSKRGSHYYSATCPHCGSKLARFGAPAPEEYEEEEYEEYEEYEEEEPPRPPKRPARRRVREYKRPGLRVDVDNVERLVSGGVDIRCAIAQSITPIPGGKVCKRATLASIQRRIRSGVPFEDAVREFKRAHPKAYRACLAPLLEGAELKRTTQRKPQPKRRRAAEYEEEEEPCEGCEGEIDPDVLWEIAADLRGEEWANKLLAPYDAGKVTAEEVLEELVRHVGQDRFDRALRRIEQRLT